MRKETTIEIGFSVLFCVLKFNILHRSYIEASSKWSSLTVIHPRNNSVTVRHLDALIYDHLMKLLRVLSHHLVLADDETRDLCVYISSHQSLMSSSNGPFQINWFFTFTWHDLTKSHRSEMKCFDGYPKISDSVIN